MRLLHLTLLVGWASAWELTLLHVNDIHVRMEETNKYSASCKERDAKAGKCYGGLARIHKAVNDIKHKEENVLWLNAGDFFQGTIWYTQFKWRVVSQFNNLLDFDAMTLGNHEFDDSIDGLVPFLSNQSCPVVVTNLNSSLVPQMEGLYVRSLVKEINGHVVGLVGYLTPHTKFISNSGDVIFMDEVEALKIEVANLKKKGVNIIIAIAHSGYTRDKEIAKAVPDIDVIVGGHSHSFLYSPTSSAPNLSSNTVEGPYPTLVTHSNSTPTLVLQAYAFTKYLGHVKLSFDDKGGLEKWEGAPILLDSSHEKDPSVEEALVPWREQLGEFTKKVVGSAKQYLFRSRGQESAMGNWLTDAMVGAWRGKSVPGVGAIRLALTNAGGIRSSFDEGNISLADVMATFPFQNTWDVVTLQGKHVREVLEHSVFAMNEEGGATSGAFLQMSGLRVTYDLRKPPGSRLVKIMVKEEDGSYTDLNNIKEYSLVTTDFVAGGGDGYSMIERWGTREKLIGSLDTEVLLKVLERDSPISAGIEGRITMVTTSRRPVSQAIRTSLLDAFLIVASSLLVFV